MMMVKATTVLILIIKWELIATTITRQDLLESNADVNGALVVSKAIIIAIQALTSNNTEKRYCRREKP